MIDQILPQEYWVDLTEKYRYVSSYKHTHEGNVGSEAAAKYKESPFHIQLWHSKESKAVERGAVS